MIPSAHGPLRCHDMVEGDLPECFTISSKSTEIMIKYEQDLSFLNALEDAMIFGSSLGTLRG
jgi:hypothetical protein